MDNTISRLKDDYHSGIDYTFILAPTGDDGGYAYMSPADGIAVYKDSPNTGWALKYLNFLFTPEHNKLFAEKHHITPNTSDAFQQIKTRFSVPENHISQLGSVTFDYPFYSVITETTADQAFGTPPAGKRAGAAV